MWGDMGRDGEVWGGMGGSTRGAAAPESAPTSTPLSAASRPPAARAARSTPRAERAGARLVAATRRPTARESRPAERERGREGEREVSPCGEIASRSARCGEMWGDVGREHLGLAEGRACHRGPPPHRALRHVRLRRDGAKLAPLHEVAGRHARGGPLSPSSTRTARLRHLRETPRSGREDGLVRSTLQSTA